LERLIENPARAMDENAKPNGSVTNDR
jgi:hypothetical protein